MSAMRYGGADRLDGRHCVVTGGANGIGFAVADALARAGANVGVLDLSSSAADKAAHRIAHEHPNCQTAAASADVTQAGQVSSAIELLSERLGPMSVLVNCAGIMTPRMVPLAETREAEFTQMLDVHVLGTFLCSKASLPAMQKLGFGRIVNISSVLGLLGLPNRIGYSTAKAAIIGFTRALAVETARSGVTVNAIAPGYILTDTLQQRVDNNMIDYTRLAERAPVGRWGLPEEIARVAAFLALPGSGFVTGVTIPVDGGYSVRGDPNEDLGTASETPEDIRALLAPRE